MPVGNQEELVATGRKKTWFQPRGNGAAIEHELFTDQSSSPRREIALSIIKWNQFG